MLPAAESRAQTVEREDLVMFINACFACTSQREFYTASGSHVGLDFLHSYIHGNYRRVYARCLAAGVNHFNQAEIILRLLASGAPAGQHDRVEEGELIAAALSRLPPQRAYRLLTKLRMLRVNNRRSRAVVARYLSRRTNLDFELVKYRQKARSAVRHAHVTVNGERGRLLFGNWDGSSFAHPLFEACRQARYSETAIYSLPFSIAEGFAAWRGIPRERFLEKISPRMTAQEKLRLRDGAHAQGVDVGIDLKRAGLTKLVSYWLSLPTREREAQRDAFEEALNGIAVRIAQEGPRLGRVAAVLDNSYSSSGSTEKRRRPLAIALAVSRLLQRVCDEYVPQWTTPCPDELFVRAEGQTDIARPLLRAIAVRPELVVIVSDAVDNTPAGGVTEVLRLCREKLAVRVPIVHLNPAFDGESLSPRAFGPHAATVGLRDAESLFVALEFARFALGASTLRDLEMHLEKRVRALLSRTEAPHAEDP